MIDNYELSKSLLEQNGEISGVTSGNSMKPLFRSGKDKAVIVPKAEKLKQNDVLLYRKDGTGDVILHRIVKITKNGLVIRGDNLYYNETDVKQENIIGMLKGFYRNGKYRECDKSTAYKLYVFYIRASYPLRYCFHKALSLLRIIKRKFKNLLEG